MTDPFDTHVAAVSALAGAVATIVQVLIESGAVDATKLRDKHDVTPKEVEQCFVNIDGPLLIDDREEHRSDPPTLWFLSRTNHNRVLKVVYIQQGMSIRLRTCYEPNDAEVAIYLDHMTKRRTQ